MLLDLLRFLAFAVLVLLRTVLESMRDMVSVTDNGEASLLT